MNINGECFNPVYKALTNKLLSTKDNLEKPFVQLLNVHVDVPMSSDNNGMIDIDWRKSPEKYVQQETEWYGSNDLNIKLVDNVKIWQSCADVNNEINSNYGNLVYSRNNFSQFLNAKNSLIADKNSRQAIVIYTRPSIHYEWNAHGCHDFICTLDQHFFIEDNKLECIVDMRSQDCIFGTMSDLPWFTSVYQRMYTELKETYPELEYGILHCNYHSFHVYKRHYSLLIDNYGTV